jgi:hypothetical protein
MSKSSKIAYLNVLQAIACQVGLIGYRQKN